MVPGLINDVLDFSKIEAGQLTLSTNLFSLKDVVQAIVAGTQPLATEKNLPLKVTVLSDLPPVLGDERRIYETFLMNLVGNAIKFTDSGEVRVDVATTDGSFEVSVTRVRVLRWRIKSTSSKSFARPRAPSPRRKRRHRSGACHREKDRRVTRRKNLGRE